MYDEIITPAELHRLSSTAFYIRENLDELEYEQTLLSCVERLIMARDFAANIFVSIDEILERIDKETK